MSDPMEKARLVRELGLKRKKVLTKPNDIQKRKLIFEIYQKIDEINRRERRPALIQVGLNDITLFNTPVLFKTPSFSRGGTMVDMIWQIACAAEEVFTDHAAEMLKADREKDASTQG